MTDFTVLENDKVRELHDRIEELETERDFWIKEYSQVKSFSKTLLEEIVKKDILIEKIKNFVRGDNV